MSFVLAQHMSPKKNKGRLSGACLAFGHAAPFLVSQSCQLVCAPSIQY